MRLAAATHALRFLSVTALFLIPVGALPAHAASALHGFPTFTLHPTSGPIGTRITFTGQADPHLYSNGLAAWRKPAYLTLLRSQGDCELLSGTDAHIQVTTTGRVTGA